MRADLEEALTDAVYRSVFEPDAWADAMRLCAQAFPSNGQTFYFLDKTSGRIRPIALEGVAPRWLEGFDTLYFASDNPWIRVSERLHRPGVIRTNERLDAFLREKGALYRSAYYNEWMRPQGFRFTMGNTLFAQDEVVANVTLLREPGRPTFSARELADFERLSRHMTRALRLGVRLQQAEATGLGMSALDSLRHGVALVDRELHLVYANAAMEAVLRRAQGLRLRQGRLSTGSRTTQAQLQAMVEHALTPSDPAGAARPDSLTLASSSTGTLTLQAAPARAAAGRYMPQAPLALLTATALDSADPVPQNALRQLYGCTPAQTRLVMGLVGGLSLREAARAAGTSYESARTTLKHVFAKVGVHSQSQLVARLLRELPR